MKLTKKANLGQFAKLGADFDEGDLLEVVDAGQDAEGEYGPQVVFKVRTPSGDEKSLAFNRTSLNNLIDAYGDDTSAWIGKKVRVWKVRSNISGKFVNVVYLTAPDRDLEGNPTGETDSEEAEGGEFTARLLSRKHVLVDPALA